jgi:predicted  nucleic acid-binding Zn-ribbon protein
MPTQSIRDVCDMMERAIKHLEQQINSKEHRIQNLTERLKKVQSHPNPDPAQIQEIKKDIRELEDQLERDRAQLNAFQEEFAASCGP